MTSSYHAPTPPANASPYYVTADAQLCGGGNDSSRVVRGKEGVEEDEEEERSWARSTHRACLRWPLTRGPLPQAGGLRRQQVEGSFYLLLFFFERGMDSFEGVKRQRNGRRKSPNCSDFAHLCPGEGRWRHLQP